MTKKKDLWRATRDSLLTLLVIVNVIVILATLTNLNIITQIPYVVTGWLIGIVIGHVVVRLSND